jgi:hypothetical protein
MTAVITRPRSGKVAPAPSTYKRPEQAYRPAVAGTTEERISALRAAFQAADEKIEAAYDAAERGSPADVLLDHVAHNLLCDALGPVSELITKDSAEKARGELFTVLAALEGVMALSLGSLIHATLSEAFGLLDWAQDELEDLALHGHLPSAGAAAVDADESAPLGKTASDVMWGALGVLESSISVLSGRLADLDHGAGYGARTLMRIAHERIGLAIDGKTTELQEEASLAFHEAIEVLAAFADEVDDSATWGALTLLELAKEKLDPSIGTLPEVAHV